MSTVDLLVVFEVGEKGYRFQCFTEALNREVEGQFVEWYIAEMRSSEMGLTISVPSISLRPL